MLKVTPMDKENYSRFYSEGLDFAKNLYVDEMTSLIETDNTVYGWCRIFHVFEKGEADPIVACAMVMTFDQIDDFSIASNYNPIRGREILKDLSEYQTPQAILLIQMDREALKPLKHKVQQFAKRSAE